jgi:hypothetical protein
MYLIRRLLALSLQNNHLSGQNKEPGGQPPEDTELCGEPSRPDGVLVVGDIQAQDASIKVKTRHNISNLSHFMGKVILQWDVRALGDMPKQIGPGHSHRPRRLRILFSSSLISGGRRSLHFRHSESDVRVEVRSDAWPR